MGNNSKGTARAKRTGEKISKGLVKFHLKAGAPTIAALRAKEKEKRAKEKEELRK